MQLSILNEVIAGKRIDSDNGLMLTWGEEREFVEDGITISLRPVWKWCLEKHR